MSIHFFKKFFFVRFILILIGMSAWVECSESLMISAQSEWSIIVRNDAADSIKLASKELSDGFFKTIGLRIPIRTTIQKQSKNIVIGYHPDLTNIEYSKQLSESPVERFVITPIKEGIGIFGSESRIDPLKNMFGNHGALYGTYEFMERYLGMRWYGPGDIGECVERKEKIIYDGKKIESQAHSFARDFWPTRIKGFSDEESKMFLLRNKMGGSRKFSPNHSVEDLSYLWQKKEVSQNIYAIDANGEKRVGKIKAIYGEGVNRQVEWITHSHFCYQSEEFLELYLKEVERWYSGEGKEEGSFNRMPHDNDYIYFVPSDNQGLNPCYHPWCQKVIHSSPTGYSELVWRFVIKLAKRVKEKYPEKKLAVLAYEPDAYLYPPENIPVAEYPDNLVIRVCYNPYQTYIGYKEYRKIHEHLTVEWAKRADSISVWQYITTGLIPYPAEAPKLFFEFYKKNQEKIRSGFVNPWYELLPKKEGVPTEVVVPDFNQMRLNLIFTMRSLWNPNYDYNAEYEKFISLYFGPSSTEMGVFYKESIEKWENIDQVYNKVIPPKTYLPADIVYTNIYPYEQIKKWETLISNAKLKAEASKNPIYLKRIVAMQEEYLNAFFKYSQSYANMTKKEQSLPSIKVTNFKLDGLMSEEVWNALPKNHFSLSTGPIDPKFPSWYKIFKDDKNIYIGFWANDPHVKAQVSNVTKNDQSVYFDDSVEVFLVPDLNQRDRYYHLGFTTNDFCDASVTFSKKEKWDSGSKSKTNKGDQYYSMEIVIPIQSISTLPLKEKLGFNICRNKRSGAPEFHEDTQWSSTGGNYHDVKRFGELVLQELPAVILFNRPVDLELKFRSEFPSKNSKGEITKKVEELVNPLNTKYDFLNNSLNVFANFISRPGYQDLLYFNMLNIPLKSKAPIKSVTIRYKLQSKPQEANVDLKLTYRVLDSKGNVDWDYIQLPTSSNQWQLFRFDLHNDGFKAKSKKLDLSLIQELQEMTFMLTPGQILENQKINFSIEEINFK